MWKKISTLAFIVIIGKTSSAFAQDTSIDHAADMQSTASAPVTTSPEAISQPVTNPSITNTVQVVKNADGSQATMQTLYCPQPNQLIKNGLFWGVAHGNWKSYSESFAQTIESFVGAQWVGVNVGKMVCIYSGKPRVFPVTLQNDTLSQIPKGSYWGPDQGGYRNCHSTNVLDCPFTVKTQSINFQQIYKSLDFFKTKS